MIPAAYKDMDVTSKGDNPKYRELVAKCKKLVGMSRAAMGRYYEVWDRQYEVFSSRKKFDKDDEKAVREKKPTKQSVPLTFAQVQTFVSFCFLLFTQNDDFFAYKPRGSEGFKADEDATTVLTRDLRKNQWPVLLYGFLQDVALFGVGVIKHSWSEEHAKVKVTQDVPGAKVGEYQITDATTVDVWKDVLRYQGNRLMAVSPYRFFPDTRLPMTRFQDGEFCASEDEYTRVQLKQMERDGEVFDVDDIPEMTTEEFRKRGPSRFNAFKPIEAGAKGDPEGAVVVTEVQLKLTPAKFMVDGKPLGKEDFQVMYVIWIANDQRVIKCEPMGYLHGQFTYDVAQFSPNQHELVGQGLAEMADWLQNVITWFFNSHITSVKDSLGGKFVVDPMGVDMRSLQERSPYIMLKKTASKTGVDRWIKQLQTVDTTAAHIQDAQILMSVLQTVTGVNDNMMGQYNSGRRSATESRTVTQGAAGRSKTTGTVIWNQALDPLGQKMLTNARQGLEMQTFMQIVFGAGAMRAMAQDQAKVVAAQTRFADFKATPEELVANNDFFEMDGTLQSEKGYIAQSLQELLSMLNTPEMCLTMNIDPADMVKAIQALRGITNLGDFALTPERQQQLQQQIQSEQNAQRKQPSESISLPYKDAPPDIQRQIEAMMGFQPSDPQVAAMHAVRTNPPPTLTNGSRSNSSHS